MSETMDEMMARFEREREADLVAIKLGLARQTEQHGIMYWSGNGQQFRAGYEAGKAVQPAQSSTLAAGELAPLQAAAPEADTAVTEVMGLVQKLSDACLEIIEGGMPEVKKALDAQIALETKLRALLMPKVGSMLGHGHVHPALEVRPITRTEFPNSPATRALTAFCEAMRGNGIQSDDMRSAMLWFLGLEEAEPQAQAGAIQQAAVPNFSHVAALKLKNLQERGYQITGYALEKPVEGAQPERGFINHDGFVGWWWDGQSPQAQVDARDAESDYQRGYRHGYNRRDAEVQGALL